MRDVHGTDHQHDRAGEQEELLGQVLGAGDVRGYWSAPWPADTQ